MTGSPTYHQPSHLNEHNELQLMEYIEYMAQCAQSVSIELIQTMADRQYIYIKFLRSRDLYSV